MRHNRCVRLIENQRYYYKLKIVSK
jgi:hypothetical protein